VTLDNRQKNLLIVSPNFAPSNTPDQHRVRISLPYLKEFGWRPIVLAVEPTLVEAKEDPLLLQSIPGDVPVYRVKAFDQKRTRVLGLGNLGLRSLPFVLPRGRKLIKEHAIDLVYFSTTVFAVMPAGRIWRESTGIPFVLDIQDPWLSTYREGKPKNERPPKYWFSHTLDKLLEPWTMRKVSGLTVVSRAYAETLRSRYPWIAEHACLTLPFGASEGDTQVARAIPHANCFFERNDGFIHGVYVGRAGRDMDVSLSVLFEAFKAGLKEAPDLFSKVRLHFIGTDYAPPDKARQWVMPIADRQGVAAFVTEEPNRVAYFNALAILNEADFLLVPGSDDPQYTASKIYPYILARKPLLAVFHEMSSVVSVLRQTQAGEVVTFSEKSDLAAVSAEVGRVWRRLLERIHFPPATDWEAFQPFTAKEMTRKLCTFFDGVMERNRVR
jgi:hypothetical protein